MKTPTLQTASCALAVKWIQVKKKNSVLYNVKIFHAAYSLLCFVYYSYRLTIPQKLSGVLITMCFILPKSHSHALEIRLAQDSVDVFMWHFGAFMEAVWIPKKQQDFFCEPGSRNFKGTDQFKGLAMKKRTKTKTK